MRYLIYVVIASLVGVASAAEKDLEKRVEALEYASYQNTVQFSGLFENRYDAYKKTQKNAAGETETTKINLNRMSLSLDFKASPVESVQFFGRVTASKLYNQFGGADEPDTGSVSQGRAFNSSRIYVERAFVNYTPIANVSLTFGRLPTIDGPPRQLYDGLPRQGSYPQQAYSSILDGYALTYSPLNADSQKLSLRYVYSPLSNATPAVSGAAGDFYSLSKLNAAEINAATGQVLTPTNTDSQDHVDVQAFMVDYNISGLSFARDITAIFHRLDLSQFKVFDNLAFEYEHNSFYIEATDIYSLGLSAYVNLNTSVTKGIGGLPIMVTGVPVPVGYTGIMSNEKDKTTSGKNLLMGLNYQLPLPAMKNPRLGFETIKGDKGFLQFDYVPKDPFNFYTIRGKGTHVYYSQPLAQGLSLRVGSMTGSPEYDWGFFGAVAETTKKYSTLYANFRLDF